MRMMPTPWSSSRSEIEELHAERRLVADGHPEVRQDQLGGLHRHHCEQRRGGGHHMQRIEAKEAADHVGPGGPGRFQPLRVDGRHDEAADDEEEVDEEPGVLQDL
jgi:hypothetical protein